MTYDAVHVKDARIDIRVSQELLDRVDERRGVLGQSRTVFIERALESALAGEPLSPAASRALREAYESPALEGQFVPVSVGAVRRAIDFEVSEGASESQGGCPQCGGSWTRREGVPWRFCVDCGTREQQS